MAEAQRRAEQRLPSGVYGAIVAGSEKSITSQDNVGAFDEIGFAPHVAGLSTTRDLTSSFMGQPASFPVVISPIGVRAVHPDAEVAVARAAASRGIPMCLSTFASKAMKDVVAANPHTIFQSYWIGSRREMEARLQWAKEAGAVGAIVTLDWSFSNGRDWRSPCIPERIDVRSALGFAPNVLRHPRWLLDYFKSGTIPELTVPNVNGGDGPAPTFIEAYRRWMESDPPSWADVAWLREQWVGPFMVKGITRVDDARRAIDVGATAISVSNHGGNNLDGTPGSIRALPAIAEAVGRQVELVLDGGIRRGSDVVKALALGAHSVMVGRAYLWGLAANGQAGVENVLDILRKGIDSTIMGLGHRSAHDLRRCDVIVPLGFERRLCSQEDLGTGWPARDRVAFQPHA